MTDHSEQDGMAAMGKLLKRVDEIAARAPSKQELGEKSQHCDEHGEYIATGTRYLALGKPHDIWTRCPVCDKAREDAIAAQAAAERLERAHAERRRQLEQADIPRRFIGRTFENFEAGTPEQAAALAICRDYAESWPDQAKSGAGLVLSGKPGTGKSHLAGAIIQAVMSPKHWARYVTCGDLVRAVRGAWRKDSEKSESDVLSMFGEEIDLLVIDEIGVQYGTEGEQTVIFDVLDRRYREMRPFILLTNEGKAGLSRYIGDRIFDRLRETSRWVSFDWPSHRPQMRGQA